MSEPEVSVVVIEDHAVTRLGIVALLGGRPGLRVVAEARSLAEAELALDAHRPDVAIVDVRLPDGTGLDLVRARRARNDPTRFVVLTMFAGPEVTNDAHAAGADAIVDKQNDSEQLLQAIRRTVSAIRGDDPLRPWPSKRSERALSEREVEVLTLIAAGLTNGEIAQRLDVRWTTVRTHVVHILGKLGARDRTEAAAIATRRGILDLTKDRRD